MEVGYSQAASSIQSFVCSSGWLGLSPTPGSFSMQLQARSKLEAVGSCHAARTHRCSAAGAMGFLSPSSSRNSTDQSPAGGSYNRHVSMHVSKDGLSPSKSFRLYAARSALAVHGRGEYLQGQSLAHSQCCRHSACSSLLRTSTDYKKQGGSFFCSEAARCRVKKLSPGTVAAAHNCWLADALQRHLIHPLLTRRQQLSVPGLDSSLAVCRDTFNPKASSASESSSGSPPASSSPPPLRTPFPSPPPPRFLPLSPPPPPSLSPSPSLHSLPLPVPSSSASSLSDPSSTPSSPSSSSTTSSSSSSSPSSSSSLSSSSASYTSSSSSFSSSFVDSTSLPPSNVPGDLDGAFESGEVRFGVPPGTEVHASAAGQGPLSRTPLSTPQVHASATHVPSSMQPSMPAALEHASADVSSYSGADATPRISDTAADNNSDIPGSSSYAPAHAAREPQRRGGRHETLDTWLLHREHQDSSLELPQQRGLEQAPHVQVLQKSGGSAQLMGSGATSGARGGETNGESGPRTGLRLRRPPPSDPHPRAAGKPPDPPTTFLDSHLDLLTNENSGELLGLLGHSGSLPKATEGERQQQPEERQQKQQRRRQLADGEKRRSHRAPHVAHGDSAPALTVAISEGKQEEEQEQKQEEQEKEREHEQQWQEQEWQGQGLGQEDGQEEWEEQGQGQGHNEEQDVLEQEEQGQGQGQGQGQWQEEGGSMSERSSPILAQEGAASPTRGAVSRHRLPAWAERELEEMAAPSLFSYVAAPPSSHVAAPQEKKRSSAAPREFGSSSPARQQASHKKGKKSTQAHSQRTTEGSPSPPPPPFPGTDAGTPSGHALEEPVGLSLSSENEAGKAAGRGGHVGGEGSPEAPAERAPAGAAAAAAAGGVGGGAGVVGPVVLTLAEAVTEAVAEAVSEAEGEEEEEEGEDKGETHVAAEEARGGGQGEGAEEGEREEAPFSPPHSHLRAANVEAASSASAPHAAAAAPAPAAAGGAAAAGGGDDAPSELAAVAAARRDAEPSPRRETDEPAPQVELGPIMEPEPEPEPKMEPQAKFANVILARPRDVAARPKRTRVPGLPRATKGTLVKRVARSMGCSREKARKAFNATVTAVQEEISEGKRVVITGFGTFSKHERLVPTLGAFRARLLRLHAPTDGLGDTDFSPPGADASGQDADAGAPGRTHGAGAGAGAERASGTAGAEGGRGGGGGGGAGAGLPGEGGWPHADPGQRRRVPSASFKPGTGLRRALTAASAKARGEPKEPPCQQ